MAINEIPVPSMSVTPQQRDKEILRSMVGHSQTGGTFAEDATSGPDMDGVLPSGQVVAFDAAEKYVAYVTAAVDSTGVAVGVLRHAVDVSAGEVLGNVVIGGDLKLDQLVDLDANAIADLNGRTNAVLNSFKF